MFISILIIKTLFINNTIKLIAFDNVFYATSTCDFKPKMVCAERHRTRIISIRLDKTRVNMQRLELFSVFESQWEKSENGWTDARRVGSMYEHVERTRPHMANAPQTRNNHQARDDKLMLRKLQNSSRHHLHLLHDNVAPLNFGFSWIPASWVWSRARGLSPGRGMLMWRFQRGYRTHIVD